MKSKITGGDTRLLFETTVLNKYVVRYYQCVETGFIQTEEPYWLGEAYASAITDLDVGLVWRNLSLANNLTKFLYRNFNSKGVFLDYAGGYGLFTRLMRDRGFNFYTTDKYCDNLFAKHFDLADVKGTEQFTALTAFEVLEHLVDPIGFMREIVDFSNNIIFTTELIPEKPIDSCDDWWYFSPQTGQHVAFYTQESLRVLGNMFGLYYYTDSESLKNYGLNLHLFSKTKFEQNPFFEKKEPFIIRKARKLVSRFDKRLVTLESLTMQDHDMIKDMLNKPNIT
ncbi:methyltransferase domain-containing protein [Pedobacter sp. HMF7647]|uniref:Methyltransferase domain-containing protein n=1 Tax=Hufsiella arboris TaxID=2695275 RepID=A0A7K1Y6E7_9SPHI|nr:class I SAM-dependent methyltransferase [Hufsiella arboris]MXV50010.1 methyltransferase domain-containing protein [Hufsiella arboris]